MTIEQVKEIFDIFLQDIEIDDDGNYILELRLNPDDTWSHFTPKDIEAFKMAFKSLDMWDKVIEEIDEEITESEFEDCDDYPAYDYRLGLEKSIEIIKKYKKEIEE